MFFSFVELSHPLVKNVYTYNWTECMPIVQKDRTGRGPDPDGARRPAGTDALGTASAYSIR